MKENLTTILKIILLSTLIAFMIKYGARIVSILPSLVNVMIAVFFPAVVMGGLLLWRWQHQVEAK